MSCGVGHRCGLDLVLLWLWCGLAAVAPIRLLAWELPYSAGVALKSQKKKKKEEDSIYSLGESTVQLERWLYVTILIFIHLLNIYLS